MATDAGMGNRTSLIWWDAGAPCMVRTCAGCGIWVYLDHGKDSNFPLCGACTAKASKPVLDSLFRVLRWEGGELNETANWHVD